MGCRGSDSESCSREPLKVACIASDWHGSESLPRQYRKRVAWHASVLFEGQSPPLFRPSPEHGCSEPPPRHTRTTRTAETHLLLRGACALSGNEL